MLGFRKESDYNELEQLKKDGISEDEYACGFVEVNNYVIDNAVNSKTVSFKKAGHMDFTDLPIFSPVLG